MRSESAASAQDQQIDHVKISTATKATLNDAALWRADRRRFALFDRPLITSRNPNRVDRAGMAGRVGKAGKAGKAGSNKHV